MRINSFFKFAFCSFILFSTGIFSVSAQTVTLFSSDFEGASPEWTRDGVPGENSWVTGECAGNGPSSAGTFSAYITDGLIDPCGAVYTYTNSTSASSSIILSREVDAFCGTNLLLTFDYNIGGNPGDYGEVVYSTDGGTSWNVVSGSNLTLSGGWSSTSVSLPASLEGTTFDLGFRYTYDNSIIDLPPLAIDNVLLEATDIIDPVITCPLSDTVVTQTATCNGDIGEVWKRLITVSDNCTDSVDIVFTQTPLTHTLSGHLDNINVDLTAYDEAGNNTSCTVNIVLIDATAPTVSCPSDMNVNVDASCEYQVQDFSTLISPSDNCSATGDLVITQTPAPLTTLNGHGTMQAVQLTIEDEAGNQTNCNFDITLVDGINPSVTCPADQNVTADASCEAVRADYTGSIVTSDNCSALGDLTILQSPGIGGTVTADEVITITVTDEAGNNSQCTFNTTFVDATAPSVSCPVNQVVNSNASCDITVPDYTGSIIVTENCTAPADMVINQSPAPGATLSGAGIHPVTITVTDEQGNSDQCNFSISAVDNTNPTISCPGDQTINLDANCQATLADFSGDVTVSDNCSAVADILISQTPASGTVLSGHGNTISITMEAEDEAGNTSDCQFNINLIDNIAPSILCTSSTITVSTDASCSYTVTDMAVNATATDNCTAQAAIIRTQSPAIGTSLAIGTHTITLFAEDENNNISQCDFTLEVEDNIDPVIASCAPNTTITADPDFCNGTLGDYRNLISVSDNCSPTVDLTITQSPVQGTVITANQNVTLTVMDVSGNSSVCSFNVGLVDATLPDVTCDATYTTTIVSNCDYPVPDLTSVTSGTDNCTATANLVFSQVPAAGSLSSGTTNVTVSLTDESGNSGTCIVQVIADDTTPPVITCPGDQTEDIGTACTTSLNDYTSLAVVSDNCSGFTVSQLPAPGTNLITGHHPITLTAQDIAGNESTCTFELFIQENTAPQITCPSDIQSCDPTVTFTEPVGTDNCIAITTQTDASGLGSGDDFPVGVTTLSYEVADSSGNIASCSFTVEIFNFPGQADAGTDLQLCDTISTVISATPPAQGTGEWTVFSGSGSFNNQFAPTTGVNNLSYGINKLVWTVSTAQCGSSSDTLVIEVFELPLPASTVDSVYACDLDFVQLTASQPSAGSGLWTSTSGNVVFSNPGSAITSASNLEQGWNEIVWSVSNGSCPVSRDTANVYRTEKATILTPSEDITLCLENNAITIEGNQPEASTSVRWYFIEGTAFISAPFEPITDLNEIRFGTNQLVYELKKHECPATRDTIAITVEACSEYGDFPNMITPNGDGDNDVWVLNNLDAMHPECLVRVFNRWGNLVFESKGYSYNWDGTHKGEPLPMGTYYYTIEFNDEQDTVLKGTISIIY